MLTFIFWGVVFGATTLAVYAGLIVLFGPVKPDALDARIQRYIELKCTHEMLVDVLGREPTTQELWAAAPTPIGYDL